MTLPLTFLSDYGYEDEFAGACRAVLARLAPDSVVVDITHGIPAGDVRRGALALEAAAPLAGPAVHLAVVDPGVGTARRALAVGSADGGYLVGPDNGLLALTLERLGGPAAAVEISAGALRAEPLAATFHGRDLFAPVAAHLACGRPLEAAGEPVAPETIEPLVLPEPRHEADGLVAHVLYADRFGNLVLDARPGDLDAGVRALRIRAAGRDLEAVRGETFADGAGGLVLYDDSSGRLGLALDRGSAAERLGAGRDAELRITGPS
jgi:S-adenosylmethionine hydrolase